MKTKLPLSSLVTTHLPHACVALVLFAVAAWSPSILAQEKLTLKVVKVDSEETSGEDGKGANAVDGEPETFWHTQWQDATPGHPHEIIIELSRAAKLSGFTYLPRQDDIENGMIKDYEFYTSLDGKEFGQPVKKGTLEGGKSKKAVSFQPVQCRFVKLKALSEINDQPWASAAELGVIEATQASSKPSLRVVKVDSEETSAEDGKGANAVDGKPDTMWHTQWQDANPEHPHEIIIELSLAANIKGFTYLPRQDDIENGTIKDYEFYVSQDGKDFGQPVKKGTFEAGKAKKTITFEPRQCRFIKLKALSEINDQPWTSAAEIDVVVD